VLFCVCKDTYKNYINQNVHPKSYRIALTNVDYTSMNDS